MVYGSFGAMFSLTFMLGVIIHSAANFAMRAYSNNMYMLQNIVFGGWTILGLLLMAVSLKGPTAFYRAMNKTKAILWEEKSLFSNKNEELIPILERIKSRIEEAKYGRHLIVSPKISWLSIKAILFIIAFAIDFIVAFWKKNL
uniref:NADH:ubiquinone reductase (H(+)-translocating) n=1 Tax=Acrobeloides nanus TaxID=290746 RepID=A0A914E1K4_9BILA